MDTNGTESQHAELDTTLQLASFFDREDFPHDALFCPDELVWEPLNKLKGYMDNLDWSTTINNGTSRHYRDGIPLVDHLIFCKGEVYQGKDVEIVFGDTTKGKLKVTKDGLVLEGAAVIMAGAILSGERILLGEGVLVESGAMIKAPAVIGAMTEVRQGAYLRGYVLAGKRCVLGHTTEIKHSIFLNDAKAGHFAYLGDSILGRDANLGAGTKFANLRFLPGNVTIFHDGKKRDTGRRKFGAILGDLCQTGCNSVTSPGTLMGKSAMLLPNTTAKSGFHPAKSIIR